MHISNLDRIPAKEASASTDSSAKPHIAGLDAMRALACLWVVAHHIGLELKSEIPDSALLMRFLSRGYMGVSIFFVLSGFLLSLPFWKAYRAGRSLPSLRDYARRRLARIVPGYFACLLLCSILFHSLSDPDGALRLITGLTFTNSFHWRSFFPVPENRPLWSIGIEVLFYLMLPAFMIGAFRCRTTVRNIAYGCAIIAIIVSTHVLIFLNLPALWPTQEPSLEQTWVVSHNALILFTQFLIGAYAAQAFLAGRAREEANDWPRSIRYDIVCAILFVLVFIDDFSRFIPWMRRLPEWGLEYKWPYFPLLVAGLLACLPRSAFVGPWLDNRFLKWTAQLSFGIYMWHFPTLLLIKPMILSPSLSSYGDYVCFAVGVFAISYLIAWLSYQLVEQPALNWAHRPTRKAT